MHKPCTTCAYAAALALAGCAAPQTGAPPEVKDAVIVPYAEGLLVEGTGLEVGFGRHWDGAVKAVSTLQGPPVAMTEGRCATVRWASGLEMHFDDASFVGWRMLPTGEAAGRLCPPQPGDQSS